MILLDQKGYVLIFTLFILMILTVIGTTIYNLTANEIIISNNSIIQSQRLMAAESCINKSIQWLKTNYSSSGICSRKITGSDLAFGNIDTNIASGHSGGSISYECQIECFNESSQSGVGLGTQIDMDMGYGRPRQIDSGSLGSGSYYYKIKSHGKSFDKKISTIEVLISVSY